MATGVTRKRKRPGEDARREYGALTREERLILDRTPNGSRQSLIEVTGFELEEVKYVRL